MYIRDDRADKEYFGLCEVEVFHYKGKIKEPLFIRCLRDPLEKSENDFF